MFDFLILTGISKSTAKSKKVVDSHFVDVRLPPTVHLCAIYALNAIEWAFLGSVEPSAVWVMLMRTQLPWLQSICYCSSTREPTCPLSISMLCASLACPQCIWESAIIFSLQMICLFYACRAGALQCPPFTLPVSFSNGQTRECFSCRIANGHCSMPTHSCLDYSKSNINIAQVAFFYM